MGKRGFLRPLAFSENLGRLADSLSCGLNVDTSTIKLLLDQSPPRRFVVIGSGASLSVAYFLGKVLESCYNIPCSVVTPYEYSISGLNPDGAALVSASGRNNDIQSALEHALASQTKPLLIVTAKAENPLVSRIKGYPHAFVLYADPERLGEREGFFGIQTVVSALGSILTLIEPLREQFTGQEKKWFQVIEKDVDRWLRSNNHLLDRISKSHHLVALGTGWAYPTLVDFESKCVEGGLGWVEATEAKNFTHGRFVNSFRNQEITSLIFFSTAEQFEIREFFKENYRNSFPFLLVTSRSSGVIGGIELFVRMFYLFNILAKLRRVNISRPPVPAKAREMFYGKKLYPNIVNRHKFNSHVRVITELKRSELLREGVSTEEANKLVPECVVSAAYCMLRTIRCRGVVLDYDGTAVSLDPKQDEPSLPVVEELERLLKNGIFLSVISGRGKSLIRHLRSAIREEFHHGIYCYLYNGGVFWKLNDREPTSCQLLKEREQIASLLHNCPDMADYSKEIEIASMGTQVTIHLVSPSIAGDALHLVNEVLGNEIKSQVCLRTSGRSVDIFPYFVSKLRALRNFKWNFLLDSYAPVIVVGDQAQKGGNDYELLLEPFSFSVGHLNCEASTCFPVLDENCGVVKGPEGLVKLLSYAHIQGGRLRLI